VGDEGREFPSLEATTTGENPTNGEEGATFVGVCMVFLVGDSCGVLVGEGGRADVLFAERGVNGDGVLVIYHQNVRREQSVYAAIGAYCDDQAADCKVAKTEERSQEICWGLDSGRGGGYEGGVMKVVQLEVWSGKALLL
jgi:hypothetical protein